MKAKQISYVQNAVDSLHYTLEKPWSKKWQGIVFGFPST